MGNLASAELVVLALVGAGLFAYITGRVMMVLAGFHDEHWGWGVVALIPLGWLIYAAAKWEQAKDGFYYILFAGALVLISAVDFDGGELDFSNHKKLWQRGHAQWISLLGKDELRTVAPLDTKKQGIHKCIEQATGTMTYTDKPCGEGMIEMVETPDGNGNPVDMGDMSRPPVEVGERQASIVPRTDFECDNSRIYCSQMTSCDEALFFHKNCPGSILDTDGDGKPCDKEWCGENFTPMY